mgnify:CR=1 FL=1
MGYSVFHLAAGGNIHHFLVRDQQLLPQKRILNCPNHRADKGLLSVFVQTREVSVGDARYILRLHLRGSCTGFLREKLFDYVDIVVAPVLIGGKDTSTLIDGKSLLSQSDGVFGFQGASVCNRRGEGPG